MTREDYIEILKQYKEKPTLINEISSIEEAVWLDEALDAAIKALEQEPCEEMISKKAIIDKLQTNEASDYFGSVTCAEIIDFINDLPLVSSKQETVSKESYDAEYFARKDAEFQLYKAEQEPCEDEELDFVQPHKRIPVNLEVCEDAISRSRLKEVFHRNIVNGEAFDDLIDAQPSVQPKQKIGQWIFDQHNWHCSECGESPKTMGYVGSAEFMAEHFKYCNHCGLKMEG